MSDPSDGVEVFVSLEVLPMVTMKCAAFRTTTFSSIV